MTDDDEAIGRRVAQARSRAGLTQAELSSLASLDRSALAKIEGGHRRVSALELARIATALGERIEWFVMSTPPAIVSHRNLREPGAESPSIDRMAEKIAWNVDFVAGRDDRLLLASPDVLPRPANLQEAERAAVRARTLLELAPEEPALDVATMLAKLGLLAFALDIGSDAADAASILLPAGGVAIVNGHLHVGRRRLALAHELGHYLFADEYSVDWRIAERDDDAWEARLDRFARALLLPEKGIRAHWMALRGNGDDLRTAAVKSASAFRVDMSTLARRLAELGVVDQADAAQIRAVRTTKADIVEFNLVVNDEFAAPALARPYVEAVLRLYRQEMVSAARATDLLFETWTEDDLPELPDLPATAIWNFV